MLIDMWWRRLWLFLRRDRARRELEEEMQLHRELRARSLVQGGIPSAEAAITARRRFGHQATLSERSQESWGFQKSDELRLNLRYALRRLAHRKGYTTAIILVLGLGVGATTAMFSAVDAVLIRALPFREPDRLVTLHNVEIPYFSPNEQGGGDAPSRIDLPTVTALPELFSSVAVFAAGRLNLRDENQPQRVRVGVVTESFFRTLGVDAALGRTFAPEEGVPGAPAVVILSDAIWAGQYGSRAMLGETILLDDQPHQVIGIMPRGFSFPEQSDLWIAMSVPNTPATFAAFRNYIPSEVIARLAPGVNLAAANSQLLERWTRTLNAGHVPAQMRQAMLANLRAQGAVRSLKGVLSGDSARANLVLLGATVLLLLIACANVAHLLLSEAANRTREMAVRTALGASRVRVFREVLIESLLLAGGGVATGLLLAPIVLNTLHVLVPGGLAGLATPRIDWRVLSFAAALGLITGIGFGLWPARAAARTDPAETMKSGGDTKTTRRRGTGRILITAELALTLMLLIGSGLLLRSYAHLMQVERGMDTTHAATLELSFASATPAPVRLTRMEAMLERLRTTPGIEHAAAVNDLPLGGAAGTLQLLGPADGSSALPMEQRGARYLLVSANYFATLGIPIKSGRDFTPRDDSPTAPTVIINEALARRWFPNVDPVGRHIGGPGRSQRYTVIGVVEDVREVGLEQEAMPQLYHPVYRGMPGSFALVARGRAQPEQLLAALQKAVREVDPAQAVTRARTMDQVVRDSVAPQRANALLISLFAALAIVLAALGVYSVVRHSMSQRGREFGIRAALGATSGQLLLMVSREMLAIVALGIALGLAGAWAGARVVEAMVYGVTVHDPMTFVISPLTLGVIAMAAAAFPLRSASQAMQKGVIRAE